MIIELLSLSLYWSSSLMIGGILAIVLTTPSKSYPLIFKLSPAILFAITCITGKGVDKLFLTGYTACLVFCIVSFLQFFLVFLHQEYWYLVLSSLGTVTGFFTAYEIQFYPYRQPNWDILILTIPIWTGFALWWFVCILRTGK